MYHYVRDRSETAERTIRGLDPDAFLRQIDRLGEHLEPIDWPSLYAWKNGHGTIPQRSFLLTFDDGLSDHAEVVVPLLETRGLRGAFFVSTRPLVTGRPSCAHLIHLLLARLGPDRLEQEVTRWLKDRRPDDYWQEERDGPAADRTYHYEEPSLARLKYLLAYLLPVEPRRWLIDDLFDEHVGSTREFAKRWYSDWPQLADMQEAGHTIGGHGHLHEVYTRMTTEQQHKDLGRSASLLREVLGDRRRPFSYPYGGWNRQVGEMCKQAGFVQAFTTEPVWIGRADGDFRLGRCDTTAVDTFLEEEPE